MTVFFVNVYIVLVASSYRLDLLDATAGAGGSDAAHASRPKGACAFLSLSLARAYTFTLRLRAAARPHSASTCATDP